MQINRKKIIIKTMIITKIGVRTTIVTALIAKEPSNVNVESTPDGNCSIT